MIGRDGGWRGVGEVLLRHDDLTEITYGENARAGHPALDDVLEICEQRDWPFTFHRDASSAGRSGQHECVGEVVDMLQRHPRVAMVWAHAGSSRRISPADHTRLLVDLFGAHPRLHIDLPWIILDGLTTGENAGDLPDDWHTLLRRYPDRVGLGSVQAPLDRLGERQPTGRRPSENGAAGLATRGKSGRTAGAAWAACSSVPLYELIEVTVRCPEVGVPLTCILAHPVHLEAMGAQLTDGSLEVADEKAE